MVQGCQDRHAGHSRCLHIRHECSRNSRRPVLDATHRHEAGQALVAQIVVGPVGEGSLGTKAGDGTIDDGWIDLPGCREVDAQFLQDAGTVAFHYDVRRLH